MDKNEKIKTAVIAKYKEDVIGVSDIRVPSITQGIFGGHLVLVKFNDKEWENEQLCFVEENKNKLNVIICHSEAELARLLHAKAQLEPVLERIFSERVIAGAVFIIFALALIPALFYSQVNSAVLAVIGGVVGAAGTYYYTKRGVK